VRPFPARANFLAQLVLSAILAAAGVILVVRTLSGPASTWSEKALLNAESFFGVAFFILAWLRTKPGNHEAGDPRPYSRTDIAAMALVGAAAAFSFAGALGAPLLFDDYTHIYDVSNEPWRRVFAWFTTPSHAVFFRPIGFLSYWLDYKWAGRGPFRWHLWSLCAHIVNCWLVYALVRQLRFGRVASTMSAAIFAIHGTRPEPVCWTDARFDLLSTTFVVLTLILLNRYLDTRRRAFLLVAMLSTALAILTKESAFCLPFLVLCLIPFREKSDRAGVIRASLALFAVCVAGFIYRWWMVGGIGGYRTPGGTLMIADLNPLRIAKVLLFRLWGILSFPINWSVEPSWWLNLALIAILFTSAGVCVFPGKKRTQLAAALGIVFVAALPVEHLLLMGADLNGARLLYLPVLGLAIFWGLVFETQRSTRLNVVFAAGLLFFHAAALEHNLKMWREVPVLARNVCEDLGRELARDPRPVFVRGLPYKLSGVYFLANGFPQCVLFHSGQEPGRIHFEPLEQPSANENVRRFAWNEQSLKLEEVKSPR
jgi:dolichyl-phosphate-mannose-protein mannosyltransferase